MIQPTNLLPPALTLPQGAARQPGGSAAFVLPGEDDAATGDPALLADDGDGSERQDGAAGGNGLPTAAAAIDPWLIAAMASPVQTLSPTSPDPVDTFTPETGTDRPFAPAPGAALAPPTLAVDASGVPARAASPADQADAVAAIPVAELDEPTTVGRPKARDTLPIESAADRPREGAAANVPRPPSSIGAAGVPDPRRPASPGTVERARIGGETAAQNASTLPSRIKPVTGNDVPKPAPTRVDGNASTSAEPTLEPAAPLPAAALASSALTPLHRREIAAVAGLVNRSAASGPSSSPAASATPPSSARPDAPVMPATVATPPPPIRTPEIAAGTTTAPSIDQRQTPRVLAEAGETLASGTNDAPSSAAPLGARSASIVVTPASLGVGSPAAASPPAALPLGWRLRAPASPAAATTIAPPATTAAPMTALDDGHANGPLPTSGTPAAAKGSVLPSIVASTWADPRSFSASSALAPQPVDIPQLASIAPSTGSAVRDNAPAPLPADSPMPVASGTEPAPPTPPSAIRTAATLPLAPTPSPTPVIAAVPAAQASAIVFGAARYAAQTDERRDEPLAPLGATVAGAALATHPTAATLPAQAPLDVRHERWPTAMIERIEMIRDAANEADTRIRLVPDALGAIDVDVRRDGDTLHVRFTAEQPQTRALLHDVAPRLADAAEARGLRLGQTTVGGDASGTAQQHQQQGRQQPLTPARAPRPTPEAATADDDTRLA